MGWAWWWTVGDGRSGCWRRGRSAPHPVTATFNGVSITGCSQAVFKGLLLRDLHHRRLDLVQSLGDPLADDVGGLGIGLGDHVRQFLHVRQSGLEGGLNHLSLLGDLRLRGARNHDLGGDSAGLFH